MYYSCKQIEKSSFTINGHLGKEGVIGLCCEQYDGIPVMEFCETAKETVEKYKRFRENLVKAGRRLEQEDLRGCLKCPQFQLKDWRENNLIYDINLSMYPAPCQCKCTYCGLRKNKQLMKFESNSIALYEKLFETLELMKQEELIASEARWKIASGEITIHPLKKRLLKLVEGCYVCICTNAFLFDEDIAVTLEINPRAAINLSIDAGTSESWKRVKGFDNFDTILRNLNMYKNRSKPGQITLKYIVLPGINDTVSDFNGIIDIMRSLEVGKLTISRDMMSKDYQADLLRAKALMQLLTENELSYELSLF